MDELDPALLVTIARREMKADGVPQGAHASELQRRIDQAIYQHAIGVLTKRITGLERQLSELREEAKHQDQHGVKFAGEWTRERGFYAGDLVRHGEHAFVCLSDTVPGGQPPNRQGSPWGLVA